MGAWHPGRDRAPPCPPAWVPMGRGVPGTPFCSVAFSLMPIKHPCGQGWGRGPLPASPMGQGWGWGRRGYWHWRRNPRPQGPWLGLFVFPHRPDSRGIFIPQRIFLIRRPHNSLSRARAHPLISSSSQALPTHPAAGPRAGAGARPMQGHRGGIVARRGHGPSPQPPGAGTLEERPRRVPDPEVRSPNELRTKAIKKNFSDGFYNPACKGQAPPLSFPLPCPCCPQWGSSCLATSCRCPPWGLAPASVGHDRGVTHGARAGWPRVSGADAAASGRAGAARRGSEPARTLLWMGFGPPGVVGAGCRDAAKVGEGAHSVG